MAKEITIATAVLEVLHAAGNTLSGYIDDGDEYAHQTVAFLLGTDDTGDIIEAIQISYGEGDGCANIPGVDNSALVAAYMQLAEKHLHTWGVCLAHKKIFLSTWRAYLDNAAEHSMPSDFLFCQEYPTLIISPDKPAYLGKNFKCTPVEIKSK